MISREKLNELREKYPVGTKIVLKRMSDSQAPPVGMLGKVTNVDDIGTVHVAWQNGSSLGLVDGIDEWEIVKNEKS